MIRKDYEQERKMSRLVRVGDSVRHAQAYGLARRIFSAASRVPATTRTTSGRATAKGSIKKFGVCVGAWLGKAAQERPRCSPKLSQDEAENLPKWTPNGGQEVARRTKKLEKTPSQQKEAGACRKPPHFGRKSRQHGPNSGPKMDPKSHKNRCQNRSKKRCLLKSIFEKILVDLGRENGGKLAPRWDQKRT